MKFECRIILTTHVAHPLFTFEAPVHLHVVLVCVSFKYLPLNQTSFDHTMFFVLFYRPSAGSADFSAHGISFLFASFTF